MLYSNKDVSVYGATTISTGIGLQLPRNTTAFIVSLDEPTNYIVANMKIGHNHRVEVHVIAPFSATIRAGQPIACFVLLPVLNPEPELVAVGQKVQEQPSPFLKTLTPD